MVKIKNKRKYFCSSCNEFKIGIRYLSESKKCITHSKKYLCPKCYRIRNRKNLCKIKKQSNLVNAEHLSHGFRKYLSKKHSVDTNDVLNAHNHMLKEDKDRLKTSTMIELILDNKRQITEKFNKINGEK